VYGTYEVNIKNFDYYKLNPMYKQMFYPEEYEPADEKPSQ
jgi:hypothetical protein